MQGLGRPGTVALSANIVQELEQLDVVDVTYRPATYEGKHIFGECSGQDSIVFFVPLHAATHGACLMQKNQSQRACCLLSQQPELPRK